MEEKENEMVFTFVWRETYNQKPNGYFDRDEIRRQKKTK